MKIFLRYRKNKILDCTFLLSSLVLFPQLLWGKGEVTHINTSRELTDSTSYVITSQGGGTNGSYTWEGDNLIIDSFEYNNTTYNYTVKADKVIIRRTGNTVTTGERCSLFAEASPQNSKTLIPSYPRLESTNNCDIAAVMGGNVINRGVLDLFHNDASGDDSAKNIERVDFIFSGGVTTPIDSNELTQTGVVVTEKSGNNDVLVAAILSLDNNGDPSSYGPAVRIYHNGAGSNTKYAYGMTNIRYPLTFLANEKNPPQNYVYQINEYTETLGMVFVDMEALDLTSGQTWYGFSYFSPDIGDNSPNAKGQITLNKDPVNYQSFPQDTDQSIEYGDADVYGGVGGYFVKNSLNNITGTAFKDENKNGILNAGEARLPNIEIKLYRDDNSDGALQISDTELTTINTDNTGTYSFVGIPNGNYLVVLNENDTDIPSSYQLNTTNLIAVIINNTDSSQKNFPFIPIDSTLLISKTVTPTTAVPGENLTYTITVTNNGIADATGVKVVDVLSSAVLYLSDDSNGNYNSTTGLWDIGSIPQGDSQTLNITVRAN